MSSRSAIDTDFPLAESRDDRRAFISEFASKMQTVEDLKIEGGIPRDERRETLRAMGACPLRKVVLIGVNSPAGNTWGLHGADIESHGIKYVSLESFFSGHSSWHMSGRRRVYSSAAMAWHSSQVSTR